LLPVAGSNVYTFHLGPMVNRPTAATKLPAAAIQNALSKHPGP
jgi:hypothetical protein